MRAGWIRGLVLAATVVAPAIFCMAMEFVEGENAEAMLTRAGRPLAPPLAVEIVAQALEGLGHAHAAGVVHRDIKDANLLVTRVGDGVSVKVSDFGLAKSYETSGASGFTRTWVTCRFSRIEAIPPSASVSRRGRASALRNSWTSRSSIPPEKEKDSTFRSRRRAYSSFHTGSGS